MGDAEQVRPETWAGARFRALRKERGWSQQDVARRMGWSQATVTRLEAATRPTSLNEIAALAALYGLKLSDFLAGAPGSPRRACSHCRGRPPEGFTCNTCGKSA